MNNFPAQREPSTLFSKIRARVSFAYEVLVKVDLRTVLAFRTLLKDYSHATNKIRLGHYFCPWYTYPFLEHLMSCDLKNLSVFEFGGGESTKFWAEKSRKVITLEKDKNWFESIKKTNADATNLTCIHRNDFQGYTGAIKEYSELFDVIIIDGHWRKICTENSINSLSSDGCIIVDNSDWCPESCSLLKDYGFSRIDFGGFGPSNQFTWTTSLFFRSLFSPLLNPNNSPSTLGYVRPQEAGYMFDGEENK